MNNIENNSKEKQNMNPIVKYLIIALTTIGVAGAGIFAVYKSNEVKQAAQTQQVVEQVVETPAEAPETVQVQDDSLLKDKSGQETIDFEKICKNWYSTYSAQIKEGTTWEEFYEQGQVFWESTDKNEEETLTNLLTYFAEVEELPEEAANIDVVLQSLLDSVKAGELSAEDALATISQAYADGSINSANEDLVSSVIRELIDKTKEVNDLGVIGKYDDGTEYVDFTSPNLDKYWDVFDRIGEEVRSGKYSSGKVVDGVTTIYPFDVEELDTPQTMYATTTAVYLDGPDNISFEKLGTLNVNDPVTVTGIVEEYHDKEVLYYQIRIPGSSENSDSYAYVNGSNLDTKKIATSSSNKGTSSQSSSQQQPAKAEESNQGQPQQQASNNTSGDSQASNTGSGVPGLPPISGTLGDGNCGATGINWDF